MALRHNTCHRFKQGINRSSLLTSTLPPREEKRKKRERDLQTEYKNSFTNNTNNANYIRNKTKYTKQILRFLELGAGHWRPTSSCRAAPGRPGQALAAGRNWTQECTDLRLDQNHRQDNEQGPLQKAAMDEESETLMIPQL